MLQILSNIPLYVWPLLFFMMVGGLKARKRHSVPFILPLAIPTLFFFWSFISFFSRFRDDQLSIRLFGLCFTVGFAAGISYAARLPLHIDKEKGLITFPGTYLPIILSLSIFTIKFSSGITGGYYPHLKNSLPLFLMELAAALPVGFFCGRGVGCILRYRKYTNSTLENANEEGKAKQIE